MKKRKGWILLFLTFIVLSSSLQIHNNLLFADNTSKKDYVEIIDQIVGNLFSSEPLNVIRLGDSVIISVNNPMVFFNFDYDSDWIYVPPGEEHFFEVRSLFCAYVKLINAEVVSISYPPIIIPDEHVTLVPKEIIEMFDNPVNDSVWKFDAPPYYEDSSIWGETTADEIYQINKTTIKLLCTAKESDDDRITIHIRVTEHPAFMTITLLPDENGVMSTIPYFSVGAERAKYSSGERIPLTTDEMGVSPGIVQGENFQPEFLDYFFESPLPTAYEIALPVSVALALPVPLFYYLKNKNVKLNTNVQKRVKHKKEKNDMLKASILKNKR
ncbi:MAG: hypothetical protein ACTSVB_08435 [Candidatus Heimdallarchaeaceae archaeon]|nr:MAG: hypothetical protein DRN69_02160 [Candidatus Pacearchaeota archaeon]